METIYTERYRACFELYLKYGGRNLLRIEREMREELGYADFNRRILYGRTEDGVYKPGWIERFEWREHIGRNTTGRKCVLHLSIPDGGNTLATARVSASHTSSDEQQKNTLPTGRVSAFPDWLKSVSPEMTWDWKYQEYIYKHLQRVTDGECKRLMIFLPPRHGKSELVTVRYAGWRLWNDPKMRIIVSSYNQKLADKFSRSIRRLLSEEEDRRVNTKSSDPGSPTFDGGVDAAAADWVATLGSPTSKGGVDAASADGVVVSSPLNDLPLNEERTTPSAKRGHPSFSKEGSFSTASQNEQPQIQRMFPPSRTINTVSQWETALGGGVKAVGVGAGVTGFGGQLIVIDDPVKSRAEAESETYRDRLWDWYNNDLYTRLEPNAAIVLIQTRWHQDDLAGRLLREMKDGGQEWDVINLPALAEADAGRNAGSLARTDATASESDAEIYDSPDDEERAGSPRSGDPLNRPVGSALCPERFDESKLADIRRQLGSYSFAALYQQQPTPAEGGIFKRAWFKRFVDKAPDGLRWKRGYDLAVSTRTSACYTASFRVAIDKATGDMYIDGGFRKRIEYPEQKRFIIERMEAERDTDHGIEKALHGQALIQELRRETRTHGRGLRGIDVTVDKVTRALKWSAPAEEGKVVLVSGAWNREFLDEACDFPGGQFDDQVDAVSLAVAMLADAGNKLYRF
ncbi:MAG: phage terminase large subunit [Saprospiraceae bacterium]|nr:phage terminase large subunit [Pyrinomonadaceae bacterium]